ncbi:uL15 family ribosomal protein [Candidatus Woesearchaeota archaeon]|nr:uL15 family ribosomal protein [Candidatus Woesearchaeota archaeon]
MQKKKKVTKQRGHKTHGWGSKKKHRGAGNRGGRGMAGSGKRADQKKPTILRLEETYFGKRGFVKKNKKYEKAINVGELKSFQTNQINLIEKGYTKLLGKGEVKEKLSIIVEKVTKKAVEKIEKKGGQVKEQKANERTTQKDNNESS